MIDPRLLREDPERVRASQRARGEDPGLVDELVAVDRRLRAAIAAADELRARQKSVGRQVAAAPPDQRESLLRGARELADELVGREHERSELAAAADRLARRLPNLVDPAAPVGGEADYAVREVVGEPPAVDFPVRDHLELGELLGAIDVERGAKVSGARFYFLTGVGARLELALVNLAMSRALAAGFTPVIAPSLVKAAAMEGTGFLGEHAEEVYRLAEPDDLYLVGTSEVPLAAYHMNEILEPGRLPLRYAGFSACYRREAGSYGRDTRGIIRVHWFDKVEMFSFCRAGEAAAEHERLLGWERAMLTDLELPFRVIDVATGDLGTSATRKFDCEAWLPSQQRWLELTSTSNCTTFQARRLAVRTRGEHGTEPVATLNGTLCAVARTIVALLEVHQRADGSVRVPAALRPHLGGLELLEPVR